MMDNATERRKHFIKAISVSYNTITDLERLLEHNEDNELVNKKQE